MAKYVYLSEVGALQISACGTDTQCIATGTISPSQRTIELSSAM